MTQFAQPDDGCLGAPDMIVEIQSFSTAKYDLNEKGYDEFEVRLIFTKEQNALPATSGLPNE